MHKQILLIVSLLALFVCLPQAANAFQDSPSGQDQARKLPTPEEVVAKLDSKLSLSDDQKAKITPIIADRQQQMKAVAADQSGRRFQKARKMKSIYKESDEKIKAILNDEQKKKYEELEQEKREEMKDRRKQHSNGDSSQ